MKLLFVHDIKALVYGNDVFARSYGPNIWERYLKVFDSITVCTRCRKVVDKDQVKGIDKVTGERIQFDDRIGMFLGPDAFFSKKIWSILREDIQNHDGVIIRLDSFMGLMAVRECRKHNKPYIIECVGCAWDSFWNHGIAGKILAPFLFAQMRKAIKNAPYVIYVTKEFLQGRYPTNGRNTNISNVALPTIEDVVLKERLMRIDKNDSDKKHLMTLANVGIRYKGFQFVIQALGLIKKQTGRCDYVYHIVGEGDQTYLREQADKAGVTECIVFHGPVKHEQVFDLLKNDVDIYIQPSLQEGLPRAMIEAMSCALPCIGSDVAGIPELIQSNYIYHRSHNMSKQIASILISFNKEKMKEASKYNFEASKNYASELLTERRTNFLTEYKKNLNV